MNNPENNPLVVAIHAFFKPLVEQSLKLPAILAYTLSAAIAIMLIVLLGAVVPLEIVILLGLIIMAGLFGFISTDQDTRRQAKQDNNTAENLPLNHEEVLRGVLELLYELGLPSNKSFQLIARAFETKGDLTLKIPPSDVVNILTNKVEEWMKQMKSSPEETASKLDFLIGYAVLTIANISVSNNLTTGKKSIRTWQETKQIAGYKYSNYMKIPLSVASAKEIVDSEKPDFGRY